MYPLTTIFYEALNVISCRTKCLQYFQQTCTSSQLSKGPSKRESDRRSNIRPIFPSSKVLPWLHYRMAFARTNDEPHENHGCGEKHDSKTSRSLCPQLQEPHEWNSKIVVSNVANTHQCVAGEWLWWAKHWRSNKEWHSIWRQRKMSMTSPSNSILITTRQFPNLRPELAIGVLAEKLGRMA